MSNWRRNLLAVILLLALVLTGCGSKEETVVTINEEEVGISEAVFYTRLNQQQWELAYAEALGADFWTQSLGEEMGTFADELKRQVMETLCEIHLMNAHAKDYEVELTKEEKANVETRVQAFMESHSPEVKEAAGADEKLVKKLLTQSVLADKVAAAMVADYVPQVSEEEAALGKMTYCLFSTLGTYDTDGNHTPVTAEEAEQIAQEAQAFANRTAELGDIVAAAEEIKHTSIDVYFNETTNGGAHELVAETLRTLEEGQSAGPIKTEEGYYVFQYVSAFDEAATKDNMERIGQAMVETRRQEIYGEWRAQAEIAIDWDVWNAVQVDQILFVP